MTLDFRELKPRWFELLRGIELSLIEKVRRSGIGALPEYQQRPRFGTFAEFHHGHIGITSHTIAALLSCRGTRSECQDCSGEGGRARHWQTRPLVAEQLEGSAGMHTLHSIHFA